MEFWGIEVKPGKLIKVTPDHDELIHISQATLDCKGRMVESVVLTVTVDGKKLVTGTLSQDKFPQICFDLVFEKEFELSHNSANGSVHFIGYRSPNIDDETLDQQVVPEHVTEELGAQSIGGTDSVGCLGVLQSISQLMRRVFGHPPMEKKNLAPSL